MQSKLTEVSQLAGRAADYLRDDDRKSYVEIEKQVNERFPGYSETFHLLVNADLKPMSEVGEEDKYQF